MKTVYSCMALLALLTACNNSESGKGTPNEPQPADTSTANNITLPGKQCFRSVLQQDTIDMELFIQDSAVYGNLSYNMYEKDDNKGTFKGTLNGEIIKADYTFMSEGTSSVRQVIFRLTGGTLTEGFGDMEEKEGKFIFKDPSKASFSQTYTTITCKE